MPDTITVLAVSGSPGVKKAIQAWTANGLLRSSVWVERAELAKNLPAVMSTQVESIGRATVTRPLRDVLSANAYRLIRVVSVRQVVDDTTDTELNELLAAFTLRLRERVAETTTLLRINLVVPSDRDVVAKQLIDRDCAVNVVVSPEDRSREDMVDQGLDEPEVFDGHTAFACATVGALWSSTEDGAFDDPAEFRAGNGGGVVVVRPSARVADCQALPRLILPALLQDGVSALDRYRVNRHNLVVDDKKLVTDAAEAFVRIDGDALCYHPPERPAIEEPRQGVRKTLKMLLNFWRQAIGRGVLEWGRMKLKGLEPDEEQWLWEATEDGSRGRMSPDEAVDVAAQAPDSLRDNPLMSRTVPTEPDLWPPLRQLGFSLVDGGDFPNELRDFQTLRPGVSHPSWVAAPPEETFVVGDATTKVLAAYGISTSSIRPADSFAADSLLRQLRKAESAVEERQELSRETKAEQLLVIRQCQQDLETWLEQNHGEHSLIGHLVRHIDKEIDKARHALIALRKEYEYQNVRRAEVLRPLERIRDRLVFRLTGYVAVTAVAVAAWITALLTGLHPLVVGAAAAATGVVAVVQYYVFQLASRATRLEYELACLEARRAQTMAAVKRWPGEVERLGALYTIMLDWGEIIGWMLHKPFSYSDAVDGLGFGAHSRPEAFHWGRTRIDSPAVNDLATAVTRDVFTPGWIGELYKAVYAVAVPESVTATVPDAYTDADRSPAASRLATQPEDSDEPDVPGLMPEDRPPYARERLLRAFRDLECGDTAGQHLAADIENVLLAMEPEKLLAAVSIEQTPPHAVPAVEFLSAALPKPVGGAPCPQLAMTIFTDQGRIDNKGKVVRVHLWGIAHQLLREPSTQVKLHRGGAAEGSIQYQFSIIRLDVSAGCEPEDLRLPV